LVTVIFAVFWKGIGKNEFKALTELTARAEIDK